MAITDPTKAHAEFAAALNAGDLDALCDLYEPGALMASQTDSPPAKGIDSIREALKDYLGMKPVMQIETRFVHQNGELALLRGHWSVKATAPDGSAVEMSNNSVEMIRRQPDGNWRFVIDHPFGAN